MRSIFRAFVLLSSVLAGTAGAQGTSASTSVSVTGRVNVLEKDGERLRADGVLVYIEGLEAPIPESLKQRHVTVTSRDKAFEPHVEVVPVGASVTFPNVDDIMHNVFSLSAGNRFDLGLYKSGAKKDFQFNEPGLVRIYCNIHPQMSAFVQVMPSPYYTWAAPDGSFTLEGVPPGNHTLAVWNERGETSRPIMVTDKGASGVVVELDVSSFKKRPHLNKFGKPYKKRGKY